MKKSIVFNIGGWTLLIFGWVMIFTKNYSEASIFVGSMILFVFSLAESFQEEAKK